MYEHSLDTVRLGEVANFDISAKFVDFVLDIGVEACRIDGGEERKNPRWQGLANSMAHDMKWYVKL